MKLYKGRTNLFNDEEVSFLEGKLRQIECTKSNLMSETTEGQTNPGWRKTDEMTDPAASVKPLSTFGSELGISDGTYGEEENKKVKEKC